MYRFAKTNVSISNADLSSRWSNSCAFKTLVRLVPNSIFVYDHLFCTAAFLGHELTVVYAKKNAWKALIASKHHSTQANWHTGR